MGADVCDYDESLQRASSVPERGHQHWRGACSAAAVRDQRYRLLVTQVRHIQILAQISPEHEFPMFCPQTIGASQGELFANFDSNCACRKLNEGLSYEDGKDRPIGRHSPTGLHPGLHSHTNSHSAEPH